METETVSKTSFHNSNVEDDVLQCPTCDVKMTVSEVADHCKLELERLRVIEQNNATDFNQSTIIASTENITHEDDISADARRKPWSVFQRVQRNRQARLKLRMRKRTTPPPPAESICPICNKHFSQTELLRHANECLRRSNKTNGIANGHDSSDEDGDSEEYEEYEWAGQKRIRVSSFLRGGYATLGVGQTIKHNGNQPGSDDEDEDLNVDEDDTHIYGPAQYSEADVIPLLNEDSSGPGGSTNAEHDITSYMRRLISSGDNINTNSYCNEGQTANESNNNINQTVNESASSSVSTQNTPAVNQLENVNGASTSNRLKGSSVTLRVNVQEQQQIIESLKAKLRVYESEVQNKFKCLICMDDYKNPAISVCCWHVYCEQCWLRTLGVRKLCPQCNSITTPKDLRRIYL